MKVICTISASKVSIVQMLKIPEIRDRVRRMKLDDGRKTKNRKY